MPVNLHIEKTTSTQVLVAIPCLLIGGTENQTLHLVRALKQLNYEVTIVCYFEWDHMVVEGFRRAGAMVDLYSPDAENVKGKTSDWHRPEGWQMIKHLWKNIRRSLRLYRPRVIHLQYLAPGLIPLLLFRLAGVTQLYATIHQSGNQYGTIHHFYLRIAAAICTKFTGISKQVLNSWFGYQWPKNVYLLYNTIAPELKPELNEPDLIKLKERFLIPQGVKVIGVVSRLSYIKGLDLLLDAFVLVCRENQHTVLVIVGDGSDRDKLVVQANRLDISERIHWAGACLPDDVTAYYQIFDAYVCPSRYEGFGLSALEALALGIPVVAFSVGGLPEVVEDGVNGILIPPENPEALANACLILLSDDKLRLRLARNAKAIVSRYGFESYKSAIDKLYISEKDVLTRGLFDRPMAGSDLHSKINEEIPEK